MEWCLVTWRSKKHIMVSLSRAEAEYKAMVHGVKEAIWIQAILEELTLYSQNNINLSCDNKSTTAITTRHN